MTTKIKLDPNYRFGDKLRKLEFQSQYLHDRTDNIASDALKLTNQYELAMQRIDYLESVIQKLHTLISEDIARQLKI